MNRAVNALIAILALAAIAVAVTALRGLGAGVEVADTRVGDAPARVYRPASGAHGPAVVIAHGFAGSQRLMEAFAVTFARNGYVAVNFDFPGHGRHPHPLTGSLTDTSGATRVLVDETRRILDLAADLGDGRLAVLGHSMASDIVVRAAREDPRVAATIAVSMFSPAVTATEPRNLLVIAGDWEDGLKQAALAAVALAPGGEARPGETRGDFAAGTARRAVFSPNVEHVGVLYSATTMAESLAWLDATFGVERDAPPPVDRRGPFVALLLAGIIALARPLAALLPRVSDRPVGAGLGWRRLWPILVAPALATPLLLRLLPETRVLPVLVANHLMVHLAVYGTLTAGLLILLLRTRPGPAPAGAGGREERRTRTGANNPPERTAATPVGADALPEPGGHRASPIGSAAAPVGAAAVPEPGGHRASPIGSAAAPVGAAAVPEPGGTRVSPVAFAVATLAVAAYLIGVLGLAIDLTFTSFLPGPGRWPLLLAIAAGSLPYFLADEWLTRGPGAARMAYPASKLALLLSLALAVALDFERLFFLAVILPVVVPFLLVAGLVSRWTVRRTGHPLVAGIADALLFAWAIGVTFPIIQA